MKAIKDSAKSFSKDGSDSADISAEIIKPRAGCPRGGIVIPRWACGPTRGRITERMKKISRSGDTFPA